MDKKVCIRDYRGVKKEIIILGFEEVVELSVKVISGDEILNVLYKNGKSKKFDSSDYRHMAFYDDGYNIPLDMVDEFSNMECNSYEVADYFRKLNEKEEKNNDK